MFATYAGFSDDVTDTDCWAQNGSTSRGVFATSSETSISNSNTWNKTKIRAKNWLLYVSISFIPFLSKGPVKLVWLGSPLTSILFLFICLPFRSRRYDLAPAQTLATRRKIEWKTDCDMSLFLLFLSFQKVPWSLFGSGPPLTSVFISLHLPAFQQSPVRLGTCSKAARVWAELKSVGAWVCFKSSVLM